MQYLNVHCKMVLTKKDLFIFVTFRRKKMNTGIEDKFKIQKR